MNDEYWTDDDGWQEYKDDLMMGGLAAEEPPDEYLERQEVGWSSATLAAVDEWLIDRLIERERRTPTPTRLPTWRVDDPNIEPPF